ncbi:MAG TPA: aspartyl protease family protein [Candidatus Elarobacter sp.]
MRRRVFFAAIFFVICGGSAFPAPSDRAWPTQYQPADVTLAQLVAKAETANGAGNALRLAYELHEGNLTGVERQTRRGDDYRIDTTVGPFATSRGCYRGQAWSINQNGYTLLHSGPCDADRITPDAATLLGRLQTPSDAYAVRIARKDADAELQFYDAATFRLMRTETSYRGKVMVTTYSGYRDVGGRFVPATIAFDDGDPADASVATLHDASQTEVVDQQLAVPPGRRQPLAFPPGVTNVRLPARVTRLGYMIVRVQINGRALDFALDSGASGLLIDRNVGAELGLPVYRRSPATTGWAFAADDTMIPKMTIGDLTMTNVAVGLESLAHRGDAQSEIVGLLGFDFLAGGVFKLDYVHGTVDAMAYDTPFPSGTFAVDVGLDRAIPTMPVGINGVVAHRFLVDTGIPIVIVFDGFASAHPGLVKDHAPGREITLSELRPSGPRYQIFGAGGQVRGRSLVLERLQLGPVAFDNYLAGLLYEKRPAVHETLDGLLGASMLSAFDVYFDYANSRVGFALNDAGKKHKSARGYGTPVP